MKKILTSLFLAIALLTATTGAAFAQETTGDFTGIVQSVEFQTDPDTGETVVVVTLTVDGGGTEVLQLTLENAISLGLVVDETTVAEGVVGSEVTIPADAVIPDEGEPGEEEEEKEHPVGSALSNFFSELLGVEYDSIMQYHDDGVGFGVIAQALWLTHQLEGDTSTFEALLDAKQSGDYSGITLADGSTPDNWGDVVKSIKKGDNLGSVMSGKADEGGEGEEETPETGETTLNSAGNNGNGNGNGNGGNSGNGNGKGNGKGGGKGNGNGKGKGGGK